MLSSGGGFAEALRRKSVLAVCFNIGEAFDLKIFSGIIEKNSLKFITTDNIFFLKHFFYHAKMMKSDYLSIRQDNHGISIGISESDMTSLNVLLLKSELIQYVSDLSEFYMFRHHD